MKTNYHHKSKRGKLAFFISDKFAKSCTTQQNTMLSHALGICLVHGLSIHRYSPWEVVQLYSTTHKEYTT